MPMVGCTFFRRAKNHSNRSFRFDSGAVALSQFAVIAGKMCEFSTAWCLYDLETFGAFSAFWSQDLIREPFVIIQLARVPLSLRLIIGSTHFTSALGSWPVRPFTYNPIPCTRATDTVDSIAVIRLAVERVIHKVLSRQWCLTPTTKLSQLSAVFAVTVWPHLPYYCGTSY